MTLSVNHKDRVSFTRTFFQHSQCDALLKTAILTSYSVDLVDLTLLVFNTRVLQLFLDCSLEKALAPFAALNTVMKPRRLVATNGADARL